MALFKFKWLRKFVRRHTNPIPEPVAEKWKKRLGVAYMLIGWNAFGCICYLISKGKGDWAKNHGLKDPSELKETPAQQWARTLGITNSKVIRISGFNVSTYEINNAAEKVSDTNESSTSKNKD